MSATCTHPTSELLLRIRCGGGGVQFRRYCTTCWSAGPAIPHKDISAPDDVTVADAELIELARQAYYRAHMRGLQ